MYTILKHHSSKILTEDVNIHIEEGWEPIGGVSVASNQGSLIFAQAMVKGDHVAKVIPMFPETIFGRKAPSPPVKSKDIPLPSPSIN